MFSGILAESLRNPSEIFAESMRNLSMPYPCLIPCSMKISTKHFTQISRRLACRMRSGILAESMQNSSGMFAESQRNLCAIHAESIYALSMLNSMQHEDFTQSSPRFHADLHAEYVPEALRNPSGILLWNPCRIYLCLIHAWFHAAWRFDANFRQISRRLPCRMHSGILTES